MSCTLHQEENLNELLDGNLDTARQDEVLRHLANCAPCRETYQALQDLARQTAELSAKIAPSTDLWPDLRGRIEAERRFKSRSMPRWGLALAAGLMAAGVLIGLQMGRGLPGGSTPATPPAGAAVTTVAVDSLAGLRVAEADFLRATETLLAELEARRSALPPAAVTTVEENLITIRSSINEVWGALEADPDSLHYASRLVGLYRTQMDILQRTVQSDDHKDSL
jgi:anti-sigma factor RsiW